MSDRVVLFVLGAPGSGKGTHCSRVKDRFGWVHLSTGDLFRAEVENNTEKGQLLSDIMREGGMVPVEITLGLLQEAMHKSTVKKFLIDGFPRAMEQVHSFESFVAPAKAVLFFDCPEEVTKQRLLDRAKTEGRADDNPETIQKRFDVFKQTSMPVIEWYKAKGDILRTFDANKPVEAVATDVDAFIADLEAKLGITAHSPPPPPADLLSFDDSAPTQAPVFLETGETDAPLSAADPAADPSDLLLLDDPPTAPPAPDLTNLSPVLNASEPVEPLPDLRPVVVIGPSGVGKGTLIGRLMQDHEQRFGFTVSHTTRAPRIGEHEGVHYHFVTREQMLEGVAAGQFLEHAEVHGNMYGTSVEAVQAVKAQGKTAVLDIDVQGAKQIREGPHGAKTLFLFIAPPSMEVLESRLRGRGTEAEEKIQKRLSNARVELAASEEPGFVDQVIVNDDLDAAYAALEAAVAAHTPELGLKTTGATTAGALDSATTEGGNDEVEKPGGGDECACRDTGADAAPSSGAAGDREGAGLTSGTEADQVTPVKQYLQESVAPHIEAAMLALVKARPEDPLQFVIDHLTAAKLEQGP